MKTNNKQKFEGILDKACKSAFEVPSFWKERKHGDEILKFIIIFLDIWKFPGHYIEDEQRVLTNFFLLVTGMGKISY